MHLTSLPPASTPIISPTGEILIELIGRAPETGNTPRQSLATVTVPPSMSSTAHFHKDMEETYYILSGTARMIIDHTEFTLHTRQACLIQPGEIHQIFNDQQVALEFLAFCTPAWYAQDSYEK